MRGYLAIVAARFRVLLQYRAAALGGLFTQIGFGLTRLMILQAFYASTTRPQPMGFPEAVGYVWLGQATLLLVPWRADADIKAQIRDGSVVYELCRPLDLQTVWMARALASRTAPVFLRLVPMFGFAMWLLPAEWTLQAPSLAAVFAWLLCFAGAVVLSSSVLVLMGITQMWTVGGDGLQTLLAAASTMFGGLVIPLPLFPDWAQPILYAMPFAGMMDLPSRLFIGSLPPPCAVWVLGHQLLWSAALFGLGRMALRRGLRRLVVQGG